MIQVGGGFIDLGDQQGALQRRFEGGHQQAVVVAGEHAGYGAAAVAANAVGNQPFALGRDRLAAAQVTPKGDSHTVKSMG